jgi:hypothetical protein
MVKTETRRSQRTEETNMIHPDTFTRCSWCGSPYAAPGHDPERCDDDERAAELEREAALTAREDPTDRGTIRVWGDPEERW